MDINQINILLVEDDKDDYVLTKNLLSEIEGWGVDLEWVEDFDAAQEAINLDKHDVYLVDYRLGEHNGLELLREAKEHGCKAPIIILTGQGDHDVDLKAMTAGAADYLDKGRINAHQLERSIRYSLEHKKDEEALAVEKERLAVTLCSIGDGVITTDENGNIVSMNKIAEQHTGWTQEEAAGKPLTAIFNIINEQTGVPRENPAEKVLKSGQIVELANNTVLIDKEGKEHVVVNSAAPIRDKENDILGVVVVFHDMTQKRKIDQELLKANKLESIGILAGGIAHDFNNLLAVIWGNVQLAKMTLKQQDEIYEKLSRIEKAAKRARDLTNQLLTFSQGGVPIRTTSAILKLINEAANLSLSGSKIKCEISVPEETWPVEIDEGQMIQVFNNLFINAEQAMANKSGSIKVQAQNLNIDANYGLPLKRGRYVRISVEDRGMGIRKEDLSKIFDPYFTTKDHLATKGSGLGLTMSYSIIKSHDGLVTVDSEFGKGTTFYIYLPASRKQIIDRKAEQKKVKKGKGRVLIMDDDECVREFAAESLSKMGYQVSTAKEGAEAIELYGEAQASNKPYDVVIMDLTVPGGLGGKLAVRKLLAIDSQAKVIVSSGYSNDPIMSEYKNYGFSGVIPKPYDLLELRSKVCEIVARQPS